MISSTRIAAAVMSITLVVLMSGCATSTSQSYSTAGPTVMPAETFQARPDAPPYCRSLAIAETQASANTDDPMSAEYRSYAQVVSNAFGDARIDAPSVVVRYATLNQQLYESIANGNPPASGRADAGEVARELATASSVEQNQILREIDPVGQAIRRAGIAARPYVLRECGFHLLLAN